MAIGPGSRIGSFEILSIIGEGGMGRVYRARDTKLQRRVAVKVLPDVVSADRSGSLALSGRRGLSRP